MRGFPCSYRMTALEKIADNVVKKAETKEVSEHIRPTVIMQMLNSFVNQPDNQL